MANIPFPELQVVVTEAAGISSPEKEVTFRAMFGGAGVYVEGVIFATLSNVGIGLKLSAADQVELLMLEGAKRLQYDESMPPSKQYIQPPTSMETEPVVLSKWVKLSMDHVLTLPPPKKKTT